MPLKLSVTGKLIALFVWPLLNFSLLRTSMIFSLFDFEMIFLSDSTSMKLL